MSKKQSLTSATDMCFPALEVHQYASKSKDDRLYLFAAPANAISRWAGVPRKTWQLRFLYQREYSAGRKSALEHFWKKASTPTKTPPHGHKSYILGPNAITIAIFGEPDLDAAGNIRLAYTPPCDILSDNQFEVMQSLARVVTSRLTPRLNDEQTASLKEFNKDPLREMPDVEHDYLLESIYQLEQMVKDPNWFVDFYDLTTDQVKNIIIGLEQICRPALVVDGQHRLLGAVDCGNPVTLPCVAMPQCGWTEQIYQFVVMNEKAESISPPILSDIFASSLSPYEQSQLRGKLTEAGCEIDTRIVAVIAGRDEASPFYNLIKIKMPGIPSDTQPWSLTELTMRALIDGRDCPGWRTDDNFWQHFIRPTFKDRQEWESMHGGLWKPYWYALWHEIKDWYNSQAKAGGKTELWTTVQQSNLTLGVTLRIMQRLFMEFVCRKRVSAEESFKMLEETGLDAKVLKTQKKKLLGQWQIAKTVPEFRAFVRREFLARGIPVRVFTYQWKGSLDDPQGRVDLYDELAEALEKNLAGKKYVARNNAVFAAGEG